MTPMTDRDLTAQSDEQLVARWHQLQPEPRTLGVRTELAGLEWEMFDRCWSAPCAKEPQR